MSSQGIPNYYNATQLFQTSEQTTTQISISISQKSVEQRKNLPPKLSHLRHSNHRNKPRLCTQHNKNTDANFGKEKSVGRGPEKNWGELTKSPAAHAREQLLGRRAAAPNLGVALCLWYRPVREMRPDVFSAVHT